MGVGDLTAPPPRLSLRLTQRGTFVVATMTLLGWFIIGLTLSLALCFLLAWSVANGERWGCALWRQIQRLWPSRIDDKPPSDPR